MTTPLFVTGTDTGVGKTLLSALLCAALDGIYWKPVQTGALEGTDRQTVMRLAELPEGRTLPERYLFDLPVSPHLAAQQRAVRIDLSQIQLPSHDPGSRIIVEGAGGVLVPLNDNELMIDLIQHLRVGVIVACRTSLGTINHSLLTIAALRDRKIEVKGVVMLGSENRDNERAIAHYGNVPVVGRVPHLEAINRRVLVEIYEVHFDHAAFAQ